MIHPCDGRTEGRAIAYSALSYMLSRAKKSLQWGGEARSDTVNESADDMEEKGALWKNKLSRG